MQTKSPPQRTCVACRSVGDKRDLVRVVRQPDASVVVDATGKAPGRGAYVHSRPGCWQEAIKRGRIEAALKTKLSPDDKLHLVEYATTLQAVAVA